MMQLVLTQTQGVIEKALQKPMDTLYRASHCLDIAQPGLTVMGDVWVGLQHWDFKTRKQKEKKKEREMKS